MPSPPTPSSVFSAHCPPNTSLLEISLLPTLLSALSLPLTVPLYAIEAMLDREGNGLVRKEDFVGWVERGARGPVEEGPGDDASLDVHGLTASELSAVVTSLENAALLIASSDVHSAAYHGDLALVAKFVEIDGAMASAVDDSEFGGDYTPLHYACYNGHLPVVNYLLDECNSRVDIDRRTATGCTPLFLAAQQGHGKVVATLLEKGADVTVMEDEYYYTALDVAREHPNVFKLFKGHADREYDSWHHQPPVMHVPKVSAVSSTVAQGGVSVELVMPKEEKGTLKIREIKVKVVSLPSGAITDLLVVPRLAWGKGSVQESVVVRGLEPGGSYGVYVAGVHGMGYGEYSEMSEVVTLKVREKKVVKKEVVEKEVVKKEVVKKEVVKKEVVKKEVVKKEMAKKEVVKKEVVKKEVAKKEVAKKEVVKKEKKEVRSTPSVAKNPQPPQEKRSQKAARPLLEKQAVNATLPATPVKMPPLVLGDLQAKTMGGGSDRGSDESSEMDFDALAPDEEVDVGGEEDELFG